MITTPFPKFLQETRQLYARTNAFISEAYHEGYLAGYRDGSESSVAGLAS